MRSETYSRNTYIKNRPSIHLKRLPAILLPLPDETTLDLIPPTHFTDSKTKSWQRLAVVSSVQETFVRLVLDTSVTFMKVQARSRALGLGQTGLPSDRERLRILDGTAELIAYHVEQGNSSCISKVARLCGTSCEHTFGVSGSDSRRCICTVSTRHSSTQISKLRARISHNATLWLHLAARWRV